MGTVASQITSLTIVFSIVYSDADQRNHKALRHWPLSGEFTGDPLFSKSLMVLKLIEAEWRIYTSVDSPSLVQIMAWRQAIIWTHAGILLIGPLATNFNEVLIEIHKFLFSRMYFKVSSGKWRPFCLGLNALKKTACCQQYVMEQHGSEQTLWQCQWRLSVSALTGHQVGVYIPWLVIKEGIWMVEAETKWLLFCKRQSQLHLLQCKVWRITIEFSLRFIP